MSEQKNLWPLSGDYPADLYDGNPPSVKVDTSQSATTKKEATRKAREVHAELVARGEHGATSDEMEVITGWPHQTVSARLRELDIKGWAFKTQRKRQTRSGRAARVYVAMLGRER